MFHAVLMNAVLSRVGDYEHNEVRVLIQQPETRDDAVHVPTVVERTGQPPVKVTWVVSGDFRQSAHRRRHRRGCQPAPDGAQ